jgi:hypothetical protein
LPVFTGFYRFLPVFSTVPAKILFAMAKSQPWFYCIRLTFQDGNGSRLENGHTLPLL